jgi:predicted nucleic acid-binding protein
VFFYSKIMDREYGASCAEVLRKVEDDRIHAATSTLVILEVANALRKFGLMKQVKEVVDSIFSLQLLMLEMTSSDVRNASEISQRLNVSPYDCVHVAVMKRMEIRTIISADKEYDRITDIRRKDPRTF